MAPGISHPRSPPSVPKNRMMKKCFKGALYGAGCVPQRGLPPQRLKPCSVNAGIAALKSPRESSVVPAGLETFTPLFPALKRRAIVSRPSGARIIAILSRQVGQSPVLMHSLKRCATQMLKHWATRILKGCATQNQSALAGFDMLYRISYAL